MPNQNTGGHEWEGKGFSRETGGTQIPKSWSQAISLLDLTLVMHSSNQVIKIYQFTINSNCDLLKKPKGQGEERQYA